MFMKDEMDEIQIQNVIYDALEKAENRREIERMHEDILQIVEDCVADMLDEVDG